MNYVLHFCHNKECNDGWIDKDLTNVKSHPPVWKYCRDCAKKLGIDFGKQTPLSNLTLEEIKARNKKVVAAALAAETRKVKCFEC